eukprot:m.43195 g.43195  ORF g.43195 m.43195 type:complete len:75 (-) comp10540_c0_seq9:9782-10006(-)
MLRFTPSAILLDSFNEEGKHVEVVKLQNISTAFLKISIDNELSEVCLLVGSFVVFYFILFFLVERLGTTCRKHP